MGINSNNSGCNKRQGSSGKKKSNSNLKIEKVREEVKNKVRDIHNNK
jgi:hypothetical protein